MRRLKPGLTALALAAIIAAAPAYAADIPRAPTPGYYPPVTIPPAMYNWSGLYVGGHIGAALLQDTATTNTATRVQPAGTQTTLSPYGVAGGAQVGFNYEFAPWVIGAEAKFTATNTSGNATKPTPLPGPFPPSEKSTSAPTWLADVTGRFGYAANTYLIYAKAGAAAMRVNYQQDLVSPVGLVSTAQLSTTRTGFVVGGGLEYGLTESLSAKFEYDFYDFGSTNYTFNLVAGGGPVVFPVAIQSYVHVITVGLNYRFN
jgi:outer membrane immunogenic protein